MGVAVYFTSNLLQRELGICGMSRGGQLDALPDWVVYSNNKSDLKYYKWNVSCIRPNWIKLRLFNIFNNLVFQSSFLYAGPGQEESTGGDQSLHHSVPGQRGLPDQCLSQQCAAAAWHSSLAAAAHGVLHQPHLSGQKYTQMHAYRRPKQLYWAASQNSYISSHFFAQNL